MAGTPFTNWSSLVPTPETVSAVANSAFTTSLLGALAGAAFGAWAAQRIAERGKLREELLREIRNTNAATVLAFNICNSLFQLKRQYVHELKTNYEEQKKKAQEFHSQLVLGKVPENTMFQFQADLQIFQIPSLPVSLLEEIAFQRLSVAGRALMLLPTLKQAIEGLQSSVMKRNALIENYRDLEGSQKFAALYFGQPYATGHLDLEYPGTIEVIHDNTDYGIFFSKLLCSDLGEHGMDLLARFKKQFKREAPPIVTTINFSMMEETGLVPDAKKFPDWMNFGKEKPE